MSATYVDVVLAVGLALVSLMYLSVIVTTNLFPVLVLGSDPSISKETSSKGPAGESSSSCL